MLNLFPTMSIEAHEIGSMRYFVGRGKGLETLRRLHFLLRSERILAAARRVLTGQVRGSRVTFFLNKQVAFAKHISFCEPEGESPLGTVAVTMESEDIQRLIDWLAPRPEDIQSRKGTRTTIMSSARRTSGKMRFEPSRKPAAWS